MHSFLKIKISCFSVRISLGHKIRPAISLKQRNLRSKLFWRQVQPARHRSSNSSTEEREESGSRSQGFSSFLPRTVSVLKWIYKKPSLLSCFLEKRIAWYSISLHTLIPLFCLHITYHDVTRPILAYLCSPSGHNLAHHDIT